MARALMCGYILGCEVCANKDLKVTGIPLDPSPSKRWSSHRIRGTELSYLDRLVRIVVALNCSAPPRSHSMTRIVRHTCSCNWEYCNKRTCLESRSVGHTSNEYGNPLGLDVDRAVTCSAFRCSSLV